MSVLRLGQFGDFLSGRSLAREIVADFPTEEVHEIDFTGVESCNQSFLNEFLQALSGKGLSISTLEFTGFGTDHLRAKVEREVTRFAQIAKQA